MYLSKTHQKKLFLILPAISIFLVTLIPTLTHNWPLSWDVIYHVLYAKVYSQNGFVLVNPLLNSSNRSKNWISPFIPLFNCYPWQSFEY